jgi:MurNAc alpha-1-phosphate uridylyltransferase
MKAFILAAGKGSRFRPFTLNTPKPLFKIKQKPLIVWHIERLQAAGCKEIVINLSVLGDQIKALLGNGSEYGVEIHYSEEAELLGTGGGVGNALSLLGKEPFILLSGDVWTDFDFGDLSMLPNSLAHMVLTKNLPNSLKGDVVLEKNLVKELGQDVGLTFSGVALISPSLFLNIQKKNYGLWEVLLPAVKKRQVSGELYEGIILNINTLKEGEKLDALLREE